MLTSRLFKTGKLILPNYAKTKLFTNFQPIFNFSSNAHAEPALKNLNTEQKESTKPKLRIVNRNLHIQSSFTNKDELDYLPQKDVPFCVFKESSVQHKPKEKLIHITSDFIRYSSFKLNDSCKLIRGRYLSNAVDLLNYDHTKGGKFTRDILENFLKNKEKKRDNAKSRGEEPETNEYRIVEAYVGRKKGHQLPNPRAKGKMDIITRPYSKLFIKLEKVDNEKFFKELAVGKGDFTFAHSLRSFLFTHKANLRQIKSLSFITTARGRTYRKNQIKRLISYLRMKYYKERGIKLSAEVISKYLTANLGSALNFLNRKEEAISESDKINTYVADELVSYLKQDNEEDRKSLSNREAIFNKKFSKS
jgi:ribosomal protein L22